MNKELNSAIAELIKKAAATNIPTDAMHFSQAALNAANAAAQLEYLDNSKRVKREIDALNS